jgi:hypothetical protein
MGSVVIDGDATIYGGLDCANGWVTKPGGRSSIEGTANTVGVAIVSGDVVASGLGVHAVAVAGINVFSGASLDLADSDVVMDDQADAMAQAAVMADPTLDGLAGGDGKKSECDAMPDTGQGGPGGIKTCMDGVDLVPTDGGPGGTGTAGAAGGEGGDGLPTDAVTGQGGLGQTNSGCGQGVPGVGGPEGLTGLGAAGPGSLMMNAFTPAAGAVGLAGKPGQGGGGGGGGRDCDMSAANKIGPGGGGGGSGGCGGQVPGAPGLPGPSAFGILSHDASVTLLNVSIQAGHGGNGGTGQNGQPGGFGGFNGDAASAGACNGGQGGDGGRAGGGGGGIGGHSIAIGFTGTEPAQTNVTLTVGAFGLGGLAGNLSVEPTAQGEDGVSCRVFDFGGGTCVTP